MTALVVTRSVRSLGLRHFVRSRGSEDSTRATGAGGPAVDSIAAMATNPHYRCLGRAVQHSRGVAAATPVGGAHAETCVTAVTAGADEAKTVPPGATGTSSAHAGRTAIPAGPANADDQASPKATSATVTAVAEVSGAAGPTCSPQGRCCRDAHAASTPGAGGATCTGGRAASPTRATHGETRSDQGGRSRITAEAAGPGHPRGDGTADTAGPAPDQV